NYRIETYRNDATGVHVYEYNEDETELSLGIVTPGYANVSSPTNHLYSSTAQITANLQSNFLGIMDISCALVIDEDKQPNISIING
ncbi:hypothetical protein PJN21_29460, partial [Mycobacterium kansasii]